MAQSPHDNRGHWPQAETSASGTSRRATNGGFRSQTVRRCHVLSVQRRRYTFPDMTHVDPNSSDAFARLSGIERTSAMLAAPSVARPRGDTPCSARRRLTVLSSVRFPQTPAVESGQRDANDPFWPFTGFALCDLFVFHDKHFMRRFPTHDLMCFLLTTRPGPEAQRKVNCSIKAAASRSARCSISATSSNVPPPRLQSSPKIRTIGPSVERPAVLVLVTLKPCRLLCRKHV
jgi:hypothetical protein